MSGVALVSFAARLQFIKPSGRWGSSAGIFMTAGGSYYPLMLLFPVINKICIYLLSLVVEIRGAARMYKDLAMYLPKGVFISPVRAHCIVGGEALLLVDRIVSHVEKRNNLTSSAMQ